MDLNELPPEFDYDFLDESYVNPSYCTKAEVGGGGGWLGQYMILSMFQIKIKLQFLSASI
jgi:hypothetical protein